MSDRRRERGRRPPVQAGFDSWSQGEHKASARIARGIVVPAARPGFTLSPNARVFHIGSRFARGMETDLAAAGVQTLSRDPSAALAVLRSNPTRGLLNKYNPVAIRQELDWASGIEDFPREFLLSHGGAYVDPGLHELAPAGDMNTIMRRREGVSAYFARAFRADLVVITLSTTEVWFDRRTRLALNGPPLKRIYRTDPDRFSFRPVLFEEVLAHLKAACSVLNGENPKLKIVIAVSPVPLERTYGPEDIIVATQTAKSTLHAAATQVAAATPSVDYFPCYEAVSTSDPARAWESDRRTVRPEMMRALTAAFIERYGLMLTPESPTAGRA
ncbi:MAG: GSCFA domain-containing protein [Pseudomonadota bacterium]